LTLSHSYAIKTAYGHDYSNDNGHYPQPAGGREVDALTSEGFTVIEMVI
jgi:hypothetical protein